HGVPALSAEPVIHLRHRAEFAAVARILSLDEPRRPQNRIEGASGGFPSHRHFLGEDRRGQARSLQNLISPSRFRSRLQATVASGSLIWNGCCERSTASR